MARRAEGVEVGVTQGIIRNIRTESACARVLCVKKEAAALLPNTMGNILTGFTFLIPKHGLRSKENSSLSSASLMGMPGQNRMFLMVIFAEFFLYMRSVFPRLDDLAESHRIRRG